MSLKKQWDYSRIFLYLLFFMALVCLRFVLLHGEPIGLALTYAMSAAGLQPFVSALLFFATSLLGGSWIDILLYGAQALLLFFGFLCRAGLEKRQLRFVGLPPLLALAIGLGLFVGFAPFSVYYLPFAFALDTLVQKVCIASAVFLLAAAFAVGVKALTRKFLKCRLRGDELVFSVLFFVLIGIGACRFLGLNAYLGCAFFILLLFVCVTKDASGLICAFVLALPPFLVVGVSPERFFVYGVVCVLFIKSGRLSAVFAFLAVFFSYAYFDGLFLFSTGALTGAILSAVVPALAFVLIPTPFIRSMEMKLVFYREKHLSRIAINRNRAIIGEKLFEISAMFREIQSTFQALGGAEAEEGAKEYIRGCVVEQVCKQCSSFPACKRKNVFAELDKLIHVGCLKGKTNLIDLPKNLSDVCLRQSDVLYAVNRQLGEYQRYMTEAENAKSGRTLLAGQAQGVSEILKNLALEQSEPLKMYAEREHALNTALLTAGVVCSEVMISGEEDDPTLSLVTFGRVNVKKIAIVATQIFGFEMTVSERLTLGNDKFCCILRKKPQFDAAFGVSSAKKAGETASGDTHSVIKIDERRFMVALSDGMGSGEYARRISESTISLLESFYRAKMPSETVLSTVNKLLSFSKEETFACVDIAVVDLDNGKADVVKIGSPIGFILSGNTVKVLESSSLPLGILDCLRPDTATYQLLENDVLLFLSDGVADAFGSTTDLYDVLKNIPFANPQQLADLLVQQALKAYGGVAKDDMTAVAVRLFRAA